MIQKSTKQNLEYAAYLADKAPGYEHTVLLDIEKNKEDLRDIDYLYSELGKKHPVGNVISTYRDCQGQLHYIIDPPSHQLVVGSTGSGKSSLVFMSQIIAMATSGVASMVVIDIKGVLYELLNSLLKDLGYNVRVLNLDSSKSSEGWNPFSPIAQRYYDDMRNLGSGIKREKSDSVKGYIYKGNKYKNKEELSIALELELKAIQRKVRTDVKSVVDKLYAVKRTADPYWEESGNSMLIGLAIALIIDQFSLNKAKRTTVGQINFANMRDIFDSFSVGVRGAIQDKGFFSDRGYDSIVYSEVKRVFFENADATSRNHIGFSDKNFRKFDENFYEVTRASTFSPVDSIYEKTVDFIIYDESNTVNSDFVSAFIANDLEETKKLADSFEGKALPRTKLYFLDEFANIPKAANIETYITNLRSRNIMLNMVVQSYSQLATVYGEAAAQTILNNCNTTVYLRTGEGKTVEQFSKELGRRTIVSPSSVINGNGICFEERPVVTCSELFTIKLGDAYVKRLGEHPLKAHFEKSWECPEYTCQRTKLTDYVSRLSKNYLKTIYDVNVIQKEPNFGDDDDDEDDLF